MTARSGDQRPPGCQRFGALRALPHGRSRVDDLGLGFREYPSIPSKIPSCDALSRCGERRV